MQKLFTNAQLLLLEKNRVASTEGEHDPAPVAKLFNPCGAATWLVTEMDTDGDTLFGLADMGFGTPELGYFSMAELRALRLPFGLYVERDIHFDSKTPLSRWAAVAKREGGIMSAAPIIAREEREAA